MGLPLCARYGFEHGGVLGLSPVQKTRVLSDARTYLKPHPQWPSRFHFRLPGPQLLHLILNGLKQMCKVCYNGPQNGGLLSVKFK